MLALVKMVQQLHERIVHPQWSIALMRSRNLNEGGNLTIVENIKSGKSQSMDRSFRIRPK